ncbi:MAG TPA: hypothetical protein VFM89_05140, partial [Casimicrobiaceae bacterium]|nr:hypothetical protein [Casimicrobiaceae bacterium]
MASPEQGKRAQHETLRRPASVGGRPIAASAGAHSASQASAGGILGLRTRMGDNRLMASEQPPRAHHDMGGLPGGTVVPSEHDYALWEKRVDALMMLLSRRGLVTVDELRRNIESLGAEAYERMTYYERWIHAITQTLIERGVVSVDELGRAME